MQTIFEPNDRYNYLQTEWLRLNFGAFFLKWWNFVSE